VNVRHIQARLAHSAVLLCVILSVEQQLTCLAGLLLMARQMSIC